MCLFSSCYSPQSHIKYFPDESIVIHLFDEEVVIQGRNLGDLLVMIGRQKDKLIKESASTMDDGSSEVFVKSINARPTH